MTFTAKEIIPDRLLTSDMEIGQNLYSARHILDNFLHVLSRTGEVNVGGLYEILEMDLDQARDFLKDHPNTNNARYLLNPVVYNKAGHLLFTMQMMLRAYLSEQVALAV